MIHHQPGASARRRTRQPAPIRRAFFALLLGLCCCLARPAPGLAQDPTEPPPPPTDVPQPATDVPQPEPPTPPPEPTARPPEDDEDDEDDDEDQPAPPPPATEAGAANSAPPLRTLRPTRTPRTTATLTPTPFVAGALRLTLAAETGAETAAEFRVSVINQGEDPALDVTLDIAIPPGLILDPITDPSGQTARAGDLVRWYIPRLEPGAETTLRLGGVMAQLGGGGTELCATLLSAGAPLEHCARFDLAAGAADALARDLPPAAAQTTLPTAVPAGTVVSELPGALRSGWTLIIVGLAALGVWLGLQWRGGRARAGRPPVAPG
jgi:hypothetical protein